MKNTILILAATLIAIYSCRQDYPPEVIEVLQQAGENRQELEKVLEYYRQNDTDSLKLEAAYFLIKNMPYHFTTTGSRLDSFDSEFFGALSSMKAPACKYEDSEINEKIMQKRVLKIWENTVDIYGAPMSFPLSRVPDHKMITAEFLIENIEYAFETLKFPWASHLSFEQFCEYVLPYRFGDEPLESWRPFFMDRYKWVIDSLTDKSDPVEVSTLINNDISSWLMEWGGVVYKKYPRCLTPSQLTKCKISYCYQQAASASFAMRAMGLAVAHNRIPQWGSRSTGHEFSSVLSNSGRFVDFLGGVLPPGKNEFPQKAPKIYCETFSVRPPSAKKKENELPLNFNFSNQIDVTDQFVPTSAVLNNLSGKVPAAVKVVYLCVFDNKNWVPVQYAHIKRKKCIFHSMGRDIVYLPVYYKNGRPVPAGDPFVLSKSGTIRQINPDNQLRQPMTLYRKYPLSPHMKDYADHMIGGTFQGANKADFSDAVDLHHITSTPAPYLKLYPVKEGIFRYLRYVFPPYSVDSAAGNVSELAFKGFDNSGREAWLEGDYIGNQEITEKQFEILFDKILYNYVTINIADTIIDGYPEKVITIPYKKSVWIGLDLKKQRKITHIAYCPRNDTNNLYEHCVYELFYWDGQWISLGVQSPQNNSLIYTDAPSNALYFLHNHTEGKEERIFTYEDGEQVWW